MPTKNPRLTITFEPAFLARLRRLSELTGNSQGALAAELLQGCVPAIDKLIKLIEAAHGAKENVLQKLQSDLAAAQSRVEVQLGIALGEFDQASAPLTDQAETVRRRSARTGTRSGPGRVPAPEPTPISNRGVRSISKRSRTVP